MRVEIKRIKYDYKKENDKKSTGNNSKWGKKVYDF